MPVDDKEHGILIPEWRKKEPELTFTEAQRKRNIYARKAPLRVMPNDKKQSVHLKPASYRTILRVLPEAIEVGTSMGEGTAKYLGLFGVAGVLIGLFIIFYEPLIGAADWTHILFSIIGFAFFLLGALFIRRAFFSPSDHPTLFNRKTRQVYVIPLKPLNFLKFWEKGEPGQLKSYSWDKVAARTYRRLDVPGGTVARTETAMELLCMTDENPKVVDEMVSLGMTGTWSDNNQVALWEHIRRYMEEGGPPLQPGDQLRKVNHDKLPEFPPEVVEAAGGPALTEEELAQWTRPQE
ncbi:DUF6708 domain-containing protein [Alloalcanivorax xenomutans]|uniref:DUF6708 domain-containing protein n=1 Tax=Alloalcanivorax xenomutans TaxID=1094342 RepID=UPI0029352023|nr:DUF6708 domain-containing protein [Alloalcanivorax xenomutans]WOD30402.1 DUF6708 domain-containing protein [Alloalcanivorax xenomutans]